MPVEMSRDDFEAAVADALDAVPGQFLDLLDNVVFLVEEEPYGGLQGDCLGVYEGVPKTERGWDVGPPIMPDRITLFRGPMLRMCATTEEVIEEVAITIVHEIAHHFGIDDARLAELGWA